jgi:hypothetical protein
MFGSIPDFFCGSPWQQSKYLVVCGAFVWMTQLLLPRPEVCWFSSGTHQQIQLKHWKLILPASDPVQTDKINQQKSMKCQGQALDHIPASGTLPSKLATGILTATSLMQLQQITRHPLPGTIFQTLYEVSPREFQQIVALWPNTTINIACHISPHGSALTAENTKLIWDDLN